MNDHAATPAQRHDVLSWERMCCVALLCILAAFALAQDAAQSHQDRTEKIAVGGNSTMITCLELMPDGHTLVVATRRDEPMHLVDTRDWSVVRTLPVNGFPAGPNVEASARGSYLLLHERSYLDPRANQERRTRHQLVRATDGGDVITVSGAYDVALSPDEQRLYCLDEDHVSVLSVPGGAEVQRIAVSQAGTSLAVSPDGATLVVSHRPTAQQLATVPSVRNDKKALKSSLKFREMLSAYRTADGSLVGSVPEIYDRIHKVAFHPNGQVLLVYATSDPRMTGAVGAAMRGVVNLVEMPARTPLRTGFLSLMTDAHLEPNTAADRIALASTEGFNKRKLYVYDMATGDFTLDLDLDQRWGRDRELEEKHDGHVPYHFLADGRTLVFGSGIWLRTITTP